MEWIGALFMVLAVAFLVGLYIGQPFLRGLNLTAKQKRKPDSDEAERQRSTLLAERDRILTSLQDLDFDYALGKVPDEDYPLQRMAFMEEGAEVLRELDVLEPQSVLKVSAEDRLEAAVAARRADARANGNNGTALAAVGAPRRRTLSNGSDEVEKMVEARRQNRPEKAAGFCPHCGKPVQKSDKFCSRCGQVI